MKDAPRSNWNSKWRLLIKYVESLKRNISRTQSTADVKLIGATGCKFKHYMAGPREIGKDPEPIHISEYARKYFFFLFSRD